MAVNDAPVAEILDRFPELDLAGRLALAARGARRAVFTTSLGIEDQVLTAAIAESGARIEVVTLQTGRLFAETVKLIETTKARYGVDIAEYGFDAADEQAYAERYGINGFYESKEARLACCGFRKIKPLARALAGADVWITGLRRGQSAERGGVPFAETDARRGLIKVNPLADWSREAINDFVAANGVPVNPLHARGYPSIGCEPCTRAIRPGEPERSGRWWWETSDARECGLHVEGGAATPVRTTAAETLHA